MTESKKKVLIIDDEPDFLALIRKDLEVSGFQVWTAPEGGEGFTKVLEVLPDCILLDIRIHEGIDGFTFLRRLRSFRDDNSSLQERLRSLPVIVLTAVGNTMRPLFEAEGISDFIEKPFDREDLKNRILKAVPVS